jgi:hypothetical protein
MATINLVMANDKQELPIDSLAKTFEWETVNSEKRIKRILVKFKGKLYAKKLNYDADGDITNTVFDVDNESEWNRVAS